MRLTTAQTDRACGALLASAVGDALGAGYEFGSASYDGWPTMIGGGLGNFAPGEWTDDTAMALGIARVLARGGSVALDDIFQAHIVREWWRWYEEGPPDIGMQTKRVFDLAGKPLYAELRRAARLVHEETGRSAGNGALMRTGPVALSDLGNTRAIVFSAMTLASLTHHDPVAGEAAALWSLMIDHAIRRGEFARPQELVAELPTFSGTDWVAVLDEAERREPRTFRNNGWVVGALQAAWSAIVHTPVPERMPCRHLQDALATAIGIGHDTDTVAAIAGALLGARWGASAVPQEWQAPLHGWGVEGPRGAEGLVALATLMVQHGRPDPAGWPATERVAYSDWGVYGTCVPHPTVKDVWIGDVHALDSLPPEIDAVVSLCRVGTAQPPGDVARHAVRLIDSTPQDNPNLDFVIDDAARTVLRLRDEGRWVFLHCVAGQSRTPTVAARVAVLQGVPLDGALRSVVHALPGARPQRFLVEALERLSAGD